MSRHTVQAQIAAAKKKNKRLQEKRAGKKAGGATAADVAKFAPGRGGLGALAKKTKAGRKADAHVQAYRRHKKKSY